MPTSRMLAKQIVATYANALFEAALSDDAVDTVDQQLDAVLRLSRSEAHLRDAMLDESTPGADRAAVARQVFVGLQPALVETLAVVAERGNWDLLSSVKNAFGEIAEERRGVVACDITTAVEMSDEVREQVKAKLVADLGKDVVLREKVDPAIIGGIVMSTGGMRVDASIASQLENARCVLSAAHTGGEE